MSVKVAFITGINGQDGSYLAELLLDKGYIVFGMIRRSSVINTERIDHIFDHPNLKIRHGDVTDQTSILAIIGEINKIPNTDRVEVYNLAAQSHVQVSFQMPGYTANVGGIGVLNMLEAIRHNPYKEKYRFYQASTSELYGKVQEIPQTETTPFYPCSPYGVAKMYGYRIVKNYRESYNMYVCSGILFNHESERRAHNFVTRKVTIGLNKILTGKEQVLRIGNLYSLRDWGYAKDYVHGMWLMLQQETPDDYVLATGKNYSVKEFITVAFAQRGFNIEWKGTGLDEIGFDVNTGRELIVIDSKYFRPCEVEQLLGCADKASAHLGWKPKTSFEELVKIMVDADCEPSN